MTSIRVFETESIDLAAYLATAGHKTTVYRSTGKRAVFEFIESEELNHAIVYYERGASLPAKKLLNVRSWLFREASRVAGRCHDDRQR